MNTVAVPASRTTNAHAHHHTSSSRCETSIISRARTTAITPRARSQASSVGAGWPSHRLQEPAGRHAHHEAEHGPEGGLRGQHSSQERHEEHLRRSVGVSGGLVGYANRGSAPVSSHARLRLETPEPQRTFGMQQGPRVAVIGLDCGTPQLLFRDLLDEIPNIRKLMDGGMHGDLASITPPITVPAWACAMTGKTPGQLGLYGFRNRKDHTYDGLSIATSGSIQEPAVWDKLAEKGMRSLLIGVPPELPAAQGVPGLARSDASSPRPARSGSRSREELEVEIAEELGGPGNYIFDIPNFREQGMRLRPGPGVQDDRAPVPGRAAAGQEQALGLLHDGRDGAGPAPSRVLAVLRPAPPAATSRATSSRRRSRTTTASWTARSARCSSVLPDDAITIVMSDHGARPMMGGLCFNDWLMQEGYLAMTETVTEPTPIAKAPIDWSRTIAWGDGGYYGRLLPEREGPRAAGRRSSPSGTKRSATSWSRSSRRRPGPTASRSAPRC